MLLKDFQNINGQIPGEGEINSDAGTTRTINGQVSPTITIHPGETQFWRIGNIGADIYYRLKLDGHVFYEIARDGARHTQLLRLDEILLPPGARSEVLVRGGKGQHVEVSAQETIVSQNEMVFEYWPYMGVIATRLGRKPLQPMEAMQCKDGWIFICCVEEHQWRNFVALMGDPQWANEEIFADRLKRGENWEALEIFLREWVGEQSVLDLYQKAQERRVPFAPVSTMGDLLNSEHLRARGFFVEIADPAAGTFKYPGAPIRYGSTPWQIRMPAPALGQHNDQILGQRLGLDPQRMEQLKGRGVI